MAYQYTAHEYLNMVLCYGIAEGNGAQALREYGRRYPNAHQPRDPRTILRAVYRVRENRPIMPIPENMNNGIRPATEEAILNVVRQNPRLGVRTAARVLRRRAGHRARHNVSFVTVHKVLKRNRLRPYKFSKVQALRPGDGEKRIAYCRWLLEKAEEDAEFVHKVIFTDESTFTNNGMWNRRNAHWWSEDNPHQMQETGFQDRWKFNVWAGIIGNEILGPVFLPPRMDGPAYLDFLNGFITDYLDNLPIARQVQLWYQHDGAPPHRTIAAKARLNVLFDQKWIGFVSRRDNIHNNVNGPRHWPPRSPDLTPLDFFLWGYLKDRVFDRPSMNAENMRQKIVEVFDELKRRSAREGILELVHRKTLRRARICTQTGGRQFEPYLASVERTRADGDSDIE